MLGQLIFFSLTVLVIVYIVFINKDSTVGQKVDVATDANNVNDKKNAKNEADSVAAADSKSKAESVLAVNSAETAASSTATQINAEIGTDAANKVSVVLTVDQQKITFEVDNVEEATLIKAAQDFCIANAEALQLNDDNWKDKCVLPIGQELWKATHPAASAPVASDPTSPKVSVVLTVDQQKITFEVDNVEEATLIKAAQDFCIANAEALQLNDDNWTDKCVLPIGQELWKATRPAASTPIVDDVSPVVAAKKTVVQLQLKGASHTIEVGADESSILAEARRLCGDNCGGASGLNHIVTQLYLATASGRQEGSISNDAKRKVISLQLKTRTGVAVLDDFNLYLDVPVSTSCEAYCKVNIDKVKAIVNVNEKDCSGFLMETHLTELIIAKTTN